MIVAQLELDEQEEEQLKKLQQETSDALGRNVFPNELLTRIITSYLRMLREAET